MERTVEYAARPGNLGLSILTMAGLCILAGLLYPIAAGYVLLLVVPALLLCTYQIVVTPTYGLRLSPETWTVLDGPEDTDLAAADIAYLKIEEHGSFARASVVLTDGQEIPVPMDLKPEPLDLIRDVTSRGIPVRSH